jgi:hypothetical protein
LVENRVSDQPAEITRLGGTSTMALNLAGKRGSEPDLHWKLPNRFLIKVHSSDERPALAETSPIVT